MQLLQSGETMTCKDCYFYDVCYSRIADGYDVDNCDNEIQDVENRCRHFKDKGCIIEFPFKFGDTLWCDAFLNGFIQPCKVVGFNMYDKEDRYRQSYILVRLPSGGNARIRINDIGERLFFTAEEAKAAVGRRTNKVDTA